MRSLLALLFSAVLSPILLPCAARGEPVWTEVRSPHFRVLTDGSGRDARTVANNFEQMRFVFTHRFNSNTVASGPPLTIVAARDDQSFRSLDPAVWKASGGRIAGEFHHGWEKQFAIVRLDTFRDENQIVVYHEYTHSVLHANVHWLPIWLDEGMAEFYAYTRFQNDKIYVGAPSVRFGVLRNAPLIPVLTMLAVDHRSPYYHDETKQQMFYAEAWAMVHYMIYGQGMDGGAKLNTFLKQVQEGGSQEKIFRDVFGDPKTFDREFGLYLNRLSFTAEVMPPDHGIDPKSFSERRLTPAETAYELGCYHIGARNREAGRTLVEKAIALDPMLAAAHEELGYLNFEAGKDDAALAEWKQALALDAARPRSLFALAMSGVPLSQQNTDQLRTTQRTLRHIVELAPRFAPAYVELALIEWRLRLVQQAYKDAHQAEALEPWRSGYHVLTGHILLHGNQPAVAASYSRFVATHWFGSDHNEAVELWESVPLADRGDGPPLTVNTPAGVKVVRGTLAKLTCSAKPGPGWLTVTLAPDPPVPGPERSPETLTFTGGDRVGIGFSDTFWWGEDHFSACHHLDGHRAVLFYKPEANELINLEVREDFPEPEHGTLPKETAAAQPPL